MTKENINILIKLLNEWNPNCKGDCYNCEWGIIHTTYDSCCCPLDFVRDMIYTKENNPDFWNKALG